MGVDLNWLVLTFEMHRIVVFNVLNNRYILQGRNIESLVQFDIVIPFTGNSAYLKSSGRTSSRALTAPT